MTDPNQRVDKDKPMTDLQMSIAFLMDKHSINPPQGADKMLEDFEALIAQEVEAAQVAARIDEERFWQGFLDNEEVDKDELKIHHRIRLQKLTNNTKGKK